MSVDTSWDIDKYKEEHESDDHWLLRRAFMERWKNDYPEERLVCLARVFANMEFMGCRYPLEVMQEVATLSREVAQQYRNTKKTKLQRTFVSASDAAEDRARGVKREGGVIKDGPVNKTAKILFVPQSQSDTTDVSIKETIPDTNKDNAPSLNSPPTYEGPSGFNEANKKQSNNNRYLDDMLAMECLDISRFSENMFNTEFGKMVLFIRPWTNKLSNIQASCQMCHLPLQTTFNHNLDNDKIGITITIRDIIIAEARGATKIEVKKIAERIAWDRLRKQVPSIMVKGQWIDQGERVSVGDVRKEMEFGKPVETTVAVKMMKLMGWKGGGLGADAQGIEEPIKPHLQMVNRAGLGSNRDIRQLRRAGEELMRRFVQAGALDVDLVFSSEFSKDERAALHRTAQACGLQSRSYGDVDRFLVVRRRLEPFSLFRAIVEKGGETPKYQVFLPAALADNR